MTSNDIIARLVKESMGFHYPKLTSEELIAMAQHIAYLDQSNDDLIETVEYLNEELKKEHSKVNPTSSWSMNLDGTLICDQCHSHFYQEDTTQVWIYCPICGSKNII